MRPIRCSMFNRIRSYPMVVLLLPLVAAILVFDRFYPLQQPWHKTEASPIQATLYQRLAGAGLSDDALVTTAAMTLGYKDDSGKDLRRHFQASGAAHVLAVSGLHTGILYGVLLWLLTFGGRFKPMHENRLGRCLLSSVLIACLWGYARLTGMTPSVVRAVLMITIFETGHMLYRQAFSLNTVAAAAVLILLVKPSDLWSVSFQLSFAATAAIVLVAKKMERFVPSHESRRSLRGSLFRWVSGTIIVSLAAQLGTLPITMYYFHQVSSYFLLTNLIVLPLATFLVPIGLLTVALGGSVAGQWAGYAANGLAWAMNHSVEWVESLPGCTLPADISPVMTGVYYLLLLGLIVSLSPGKNQESPGKNA